MSASRPISAIPSARLGTGQADLILACDLIVATAPDVLGTAHERTRLLGNADVAPTGEFQTDATIDLAATRFLKAIERRVAPERVATLRATALATRLLGDSIFTNLLMVGFAAQQGLLPVGLASIGQAIRLNGAVVKANLDAFALGRLAAHDPDALFALAQVPAIDAPPPETLAAMIESRIRNLTAYQDAACAARYRGFIEDLAARLAHLDAAPFLIEVARQLARLLAYKDEYEVARLYGDPAFTAALRDQFEGDFTLSANLAPPLLVRRRDVKTGRPRNATPSTAEALPEVVSVP